MEQSPSWEANRFSASQGIHCILWNPKVYYRSDNCPPPVPILSQLDPFHTLTSHFLKIYLSIILPFTSGSSKWSLSFWFPHQNPVYAFPLLHTCYFFTLKEILAQCTCIWTCVHVYVHKPTFIHRSHASRRNCQVRVRSKISVCIYRVSQNLCHQLFLGIPHPQLSKNIPINTGLKVNTFRDIHFCL